MPGKPETTDPTTATAGTPPSGPASPESRRRTTLFLAGMLVAFWPTLASFPASWSVPANEQGFFICALVLWLVWRDRDLFFDTAGPSIPDLAPGLAFLSVLWLFAVIMDVRVVHQALFVAVFALWALAVFGWQVRVPVFAMAFTLALSVPLWSVLLPVLQRATVIASGTATRLAGISAEIGAYTISIESGTFLVESGCAGLSFLLAGTALGATYAHLFIRSWRTQLKVVLLAAAMSILGNWIRVTQLVFLGEATAMQSPYITDHLWLGWVIFVLLMLPTYLLARRIEKRDARREPATADAEGGRRETPSFDGERPSGGARPNRPLTVATMSALVGPVLYMAVGVVPRGGEVERDPAVFDLDAAWSAQPLPEAAGAVWSPDFVGVDSRASWTIVVGGQTLEATRHYFEDQRQGEELIQSGNVVAADSLLVSERMFGPASANRRIVREAILRAPDGPRITWYWYRVAGIDTPFESKAKLLEIVAFFRRSAAAELVTLSAPCDPDNCRVAARALRASVAGPGALDSAPPPGG